MMEIARRCPCRLIAADRVGRLVGFVGFVGLFKFRLSKCKSGLAI